MRIRLICEGPIKDPNLRRLHADYAARLGHFAELQVQETGRARGGASGSKGKLFAGEEKLLEKLGASYRVVLDPRGREYASDEFAAWLGERTVRGTREVAFVVGGAEGFSETFRQQADLLLALSRLTLTHDWARTLLLEQIYRAFTILRGYPYAR